jgi:hypothetical protein
VVAVPDHTGPLVDCPFELCGKVVELVIEQVRPDDDELTQRRVPLHDIVNRGLPRAVCPASLLLTPIGPEASEHLAAAARGMRERLATDKPAPPASTRKPGKAPRKRPRNGWFTKGASPGPDPRRQRPVSGLGPVEGPEPPPPVQRPRLGVLGGIGRPDADAHLPKGKGPSVASNSMREQLAALALLTAEGEKQAQAIALQINDLLKSAGLLTAQLTEKLNATGHLARAAVGGGPMPTNAANMLGSHDAARSTADSVAEAIGLAAMRVMSAHGSAGAAARHAEAYARQQQG